MNWWISQSSHPKRHSSPVQLDLLHQWLWISSYFTLVYHNNPKQLKWGQALQCTLFLHSLFQRPSFNHWSGYLHLHRQDSVSRRGGVTITNRKLKLSHDEKFCKVLEARVTFSQLAKISWEVCDSTWYRFQLWNPGALIHPCASCEIPVSQKAALTYDPALEREVRTQLGSFFCNHKEPGCIRMRRKKQLWSCGDELCTAEQDCRQETVISLNFHGNYYNPDGRYWLGIHDALEMVSTGRKTGANRHLQTCWNEVLASLASSSQSIVFLELK